MDRAGDYMRTDANKRELSEDGIVIKKKLIDMNMTQAEFCRKYNIAQNRFCDMLYTKDKCQKERKKVYKILGIGA